LRLPKRPSDFRARSLRLWQRDGDTGLFAGQDLLPVAGFAGAALYLSCLILPLGVLLATSFTPFDPNGSVSGHWTLDNYAKALGDSFYLGILFRTVRVALFTTALTLITGYPVAYYIHLVSGRRRAYLLLAVMAPPMVSVMVQAFGWVVVFGSRGALNFLLLKAGIIGGPLQLMYTETAVVIGLAHAYFPFMVIALLSRFDNIDSNLRLAAANLGASPRWVLWRITLPLSLPGMLAGSMIVFCLSASAFVTPTVLGGTRLKGMAYVIWEQITLVLNWPLGAAIGIVLLLITTGILVLYHRLLEGRFAAVFESGRM
jgi:putative spermidine/putrescine transport system permease protein